jgi:hypothetical protein
MTWTSTLGQYRYICAAAGGEECRAVKYLDRRIAESPQGKDQEVPASNYQIRMLALLMLIDD